MWLSTTVSNTQFHKKLGWRETWIAPDAESNEIDYVLIDKRRILKHILVVPPFNKGSDHACYG